MKYVGLQSQINSNNRKSILLLLAFPAIILLGIYAFLFFAYKEDVAEANYRFVQILPFVIGAVLIWFLIAYFSHTALIKLATNARSLSRKENMRVYNLTENLCMSVGMTMPKLYVIDSSALNAFASGVDKNSYAVTLTTGIINKLNDEELEAVIAHELTHIRNQDVRLLIISIVFVGILSFAVQVLFRSVLYGSHGRRKNKDDGKMVLIALVIAIVVYILSILFKFALSRKSQKVHSPGGLQALFHPLPTQDFRGGERRAN